MASDVYSGSSAESSATRSGAGSDGVAGCALAPAFAGFSEGATEPARNPGSPASVAAQSTVKRTRGKTITNILRTAR